MKNVILFAVEGFDFTVDPEAVLLTENGETIGHAVKVGPHADPRFVEATFDITDPDTYSRIFGTPGAFSIVHPTTTREP